MSSLIFCNVGARDVQLMEGDRLLELRPPRAEGQRLLAQYASAAPRVALPIIEPGLRYILSDPACLPAKVILFGTDQGGGKFADTDTLFFSQIICQKLPDLFPGGRLEAQRVLIQRANPALYDEAYEVFGQLLQEYPPAAGQQIFVLLAGGTPACNTALLLQGVRRYGSELQAVYVPPQKDPLRLRVGRQIEDSFQEAAAVEHLRRLDFANALPYLTRLQVNPGLTGLVEYATRRFNFDFPSARQSLEAALRDGNAAVRALCDTLRRDLDALPAADDAPGDLLALLGELYWNARITYEHRRYADFLGRVYRLQEAILRHLVETVYHLSTDLSPAVAAANQQAWEDGIATNPLLRAYLEAQMVGNRPLDWRVIGRPAYKAMLSFALDEKQVGGSAPFPNAERGRLKACLERTNALDRLVELRHRTVIGHGFKGVSQEDLIVASPGEHPPTEALSEIMCMLTRQPVGKSAYERIAEFVIRQLKQEG